MSSRFSSPSPNASFWLLPKPNHLLVEEEGPSTPAEYLRGVHVSIDAVEALAAWVRSLSARADR